MIWRLFSKIHWRIAIAWAVLRGKLGNCIMILVKQNTIEEFDKSEDLDCSVYHLGVDPRIVEYILTNVEKVTLKK